MNKTNKMSVILGFTAFKFCSLLLMSAVLPVQANTRQSVMVAFKCLRQEIMNELLEVRQQLVNVTKQLQQETNERVKLAEKLEKLDHYVIDAIDDCASSPCQYGGTCTDQDQVTGYSCACAAGYTGQFCENDVNECQELHNVFDQDCENTPGSYRCGCRTGFSLIGGKRCQEESPPRITREPETEIAYTDDDSVILPCIAAGYPHPQYRWTKDGEPLDMEGLGVKTVALQGTLEIKTPHADHEGVYQCFASNRYGTALSVRTLLKQAKLIPFDIIIEPTIHKPEIGSYFKLACTPPYSYPSGITYFKGIETDKRIALDYSGNLHFANIKTEDSLNEKDYVCVVLNPVLRSFIEGGDMKIEPRRFTATIGRIKPQLKWSSESPTVAVRGTTKRMKCIFSGFPAPDIMWTLADGSPLSDKVVVGDTGHEITIPNIDFPDGDKDYKCTASNSGADPPHTRPYKILRLRVESMPLWVKEPESVVTSEGENAVFECHAGGVPGPDISWSVNGKPIESVPNPRRQILDGGKLIKYTNITKTDSSVHQCNASNHHGYIFSNVYLNVLDVPPTFICKPAAVVKVAEGQDANLTCEVYGVPKPKVIWSKGDMIMAGPRFVVKTTGKIVGNMRLLNSLMDDAGIYKCTAENKFNKTEAEGQLIVRRKTELVVLPESRTVHVHDNVVLDCQAQTDPAEEEKLTITWLKDGKPINFNDADTSKSLTLNTKNNSLIIRDSSVGDSGSYTCVADNGLDKDEYTALIIVTDRPDPPQDVIVVMCGAQSAEVQWTAGSENNNEITEYIIYYNTSFDEQGIYHVGAKDIPKSQLTAKVKLSPWAIYTFHAKARNSIGLSDRSIFTWATCQTPPMIPFENPDDVCTVSRAPNQLVITWKPMPRMKHNGDNFHYVVTYERQDGDPVPLRQDVKNWQQSELVVGDQDTFRKYKISVQAANIEGTLPSSKLVEIWGYSGEDIPQVSATGFAIVNGSLSDTSVNFVWDEIDPDDVRINGFFTGYRIDYWKADAIDDVRSTEIIINEFDPCPVITNRNKRQAISGTANGAVHDLWPHSDIQAGILVLNGGKAGVMSDIISFRTLEG